jgi:cyclic pyranopterin monophosphate synthase
MHEYSFLFIVYRSYFSISLAGVMGAKTTSTLLPFCHPLPLEHIDIKIAIDSERDKSIRIDCIVKTTHKTGVEMEAIVGATHASICIYDMLKAVSHNIVISEIKLMSKSGGKSDFTNTASSET